MSRWYTLAVVSAALFMVTLDNLVVTTTLPNIRADLNASLTQLEGVVNAYTLTFGVLMLLGASAGERFGRRGTFAAGLIVFTGASAACALAPTADALIAARAVQGVGGAVVLPLSLTLLADAFPDDGRGLALGVWSGVSGIGVALGPLVGGLVVEGGSWQWVFWLNVPVGVVTASACRALAPSAARRRRIDIRGAVLGTTGLTGVLVALGGTQHASWQSGRVLVPMVAGLLLLAAFLMWERVSPEPMLPLALFSSPVFRAVNYVNATMYFGMFGCIFLLAPFLQIVQGLSPLESGVRILPWTLMPLLVSPIAGAYCDRVGARMLIGWGMALQATALAWIALVLSPDLSFAQLLLPCLLGGVGMALVYPPTSTAMLASVDPADAGVASGAVNSLREIAGALGIAVLAWVFTTSGGAAGASAYVSGLAPALFIGAGVLASGVLAIRRLPVGGHTADRAPLVIAADGIAASDPAQSGDHVPSRRSGRPPPEQSGGQPGVESGSGARGAPDDTWGPRHAGWAAAQGRMTALSTNTVRVFRHTRARPASGRRATLALLTWPRRHQGAGMGLRGRRPAPVDRSRPRFVDIEQSSKQSHDDGVDAVSGVGSRRTPAS